MFRMLRLFGVSCHCITLFILLLHTLERKQFFNLKILFSYTFEVTKPKQVEIFSVRIDILLIFGKHRHDRITSLRGEVSVHKVISIPPLFIEVPELSKENPQLCICVCKEYRFRLLLRFGHLIV